MNKLDKLEGWVKLAKIHKDPEKWIEMYKHYQELLLQEDVATFWADNYAIANAERNELKERLNGEH